MATLKSGINSGSGFSNSDTITSTTLNNHVNDGGIVAGTIVTVDFADSTNKTSGVTFAKMQHISTEKVLARTTAGEGDVEEIDIAGASGILLDEDTMSSDSATRGATQQSIKAYVDTEIANKPINCIVNNSSSTLANTGLPFTIPFNNEISDSTNMHNNSTNNSRITIATAGIYMINLNLKVSNTANGDYLITLNKNGSEITRISGDDSVVTSGQAFNITTVASLSASDYLEAKIVKMEGSSTTSSTTIDGSKTFFSATLVS